MTSEDCEICAQIAAVRERVTARNRRRFRVPGAKWAGKQISLEAQSQLPPSDR